MAMRWLKFWRARLILNRFPESHRRGAYVCDPEKNTECKKSNCAHRGGECYFTTKKEFKAGLRRYLP